MKEKKEPVPGGNRGRAEVERAAALAGGTAISTKEDTTFSREAQGPISGNLLHGRRNAVNIQHIMTLTTLDNRTVRRLIEQERRAGVPICSDNATGYYLAEDAAELSDFVGNMRHRAAEILRTARALEKAADEWTEGAEE